MAGIGNLDNQAKRFGWLAHRGVQTHQRQTKATAPKMRPATSLLYFLT